MTIGTDFGVRNELPFAGYTQIIALLVTRDAMFRKESIEDIHGD
jgi:hypothetical protein